MLCDLKYQQQTKMDELMGITSWMLICFSQRWHILGKPDVIKWSKGKVHFGTCIHLRLSLFFTGLAFGRSACMSNLLKVYAWISLTCWKQKLSELSQICISIRWMSRDHMKEIIQSLHFTKGKLGEIAPVVPWNLSMIPNKQLCLMSTCCFSPGSQLCYLSLSTTRGAWLPPGLASRVFTLKSIPLSGQHKVS